MRTNYFLKSTLLAAMFGCALSLSAEAPKVPTFVEAKGTGIEPFLFESGAQWGDYNNDGYLDLICAGTDDSWNPTTILYKNNGNGTFTKVTTPFANLRDASVVWLDYNNDGNLDLFICGRREFWDWGAGPEGQDVLRKAPYTHFYENQGAANNFDFLEVFQGEFKYIDNDGGNKPNRYVVAADFDNDGWVDIVMSGRAEDQNIYTALYKNYQGSTFVEVSNPVNGTDNFIQMRSGSLAAADFDGDGYLDLGIFGWTASDGVPTHLSPCTGAIYKNNGDGTFASPWLFPGGESGEFVWNDYNNDGKLDFSMTGFCYGGTNGYDGVGWQGDLFVNNGDGTFTRNDYNVTKFTQSQGCSNDWADVNHDGFADMTYNRSHNDAIFLNNFGDKSFTKSEFVFGEPGSTYAYDTEGGVSTLVDYDKDGNLDVFVMGYSNHDNVKKNYIMRNDLGNGISTNEKPSVPANLKYTVNGENITFTWDASTDDHTPTAAIQYNLYVQKTDGTIICFLPANPATGDLKVNDHLVGINGTSYTLKGWTLEDGDKYGVQAIDNSRRASAFSTTATSIGDVTVNDVNVSTGKGSIEISTSLENLTVEVFNVSGLTVAKTTQSGKVINVPTGVYLVKVSSGADSLVKKVVVK